MKGEERRGQNNYFRHMAEKTICKIQKAEGTSNRISTK